MSRHSSTALSNDGQAPDETEASTKQLLRQQLKTEFGRASYPVVSPFDLIPVLSDGPATVFSAGDVQVPAADLGLVHGKHLSFPYDSSDALVDDVMAALRADSVLPTHD
ncbi:MTH865 family protein [Halorubrum tropicale]|uniref:MTH865 family protein n=1 Tax=Halorubrum tropicale TaxID=1765655 RepID=UPI000AD050DE|nr:MTH865 family protein [Halorubrum tropicale]